MTLNVLICLLILVGGGAIAFRRATQVRTSKLESNLHYRYLFANYYRSPEPETVPKMLEAYLATKPDVGKPDTTRYFFARVAQLNPAVSRDYERLFDSTSGDARAVVLQVLELSGDEATVEFLRSKLKDKKCAKLWSEISQALQNGLPAKADVLLRPVKDGVDMDMRWADFIVTGDPAPTIPIVDVLEWPDLLRQKLEEWLNGRLGPLPTAYELARVQRDLSEAAEISLDVEHHRVKTPEDLDCSSVLSQGGPTGEWLQRVAAKLPFNLSTEERQYMAVKAVAKWSLASNATQHQAILNLCEEQAAKRSEKAKLVLLEIVGRGSIAGREYERAAQALRSYLGTSSENRETQNLLALADAKLHLIALGDLSKESSIRETGDIPADLVSKTIRTTSAARSYASKTLQSVHQGTEEVNLEWWMDFVSPDKYHVQQEGWKADCQHSDFDEWITLGGDQYAQFARFWVKQPDNSHRIQTNSWLRVDKFLTVMSRNLHPLHTGIFSFHQKRYVMIEYEDKISSEFGPLSDLPGQLRIWIDWERQQLSKGELEFYEPGEEGGKVKLQEVFAGYGIDILITAPQVLLEASPPK